ncbi:unnamed protein product [Litomosoides sigmodontis]|uniref:Uncharacterized protein n=1 Tax=Litomosoides sigmodontis TaxID=42156 RepID=A0A3P6TU38_LITSI|nr:unnamed protein product [Litomosoides sigmodontis]VDK84905.1 unnamed protein product [Litomosoides sigmodontis]
MRGVVGAGWSYLALSRINVPRAASCSGPPLPSQTRAALVKLMQRTNTPQSYPSHHVQQSCTPSSNQPVSGKLDNHPIEHNIVLPTVSTTTATTPSTTENDHELISNS